MDAADGYVSLLHAPVCLHTQMAAVSAKYGVDNLSAAFPAELAEIYDMYLTSCLPQGDAPLQCVPTHVLAPGLAGHSWGLCSSVPPTRL